jgi:hypothetical protein
MPKYMVRVALYDTDNAEQYERLDAAMIKRGFSKDLVGSKAAYQLPAGEYWYIGGASTSSVRARAAAAAQRTVLRFGIIAVRVDGWSVMGLKKSPALAGE